MGLSDRICELISVHHDHFASASGFGVHATEEAQLSARIIAVADALSSMVSFNVYSPRRSYSAAVRELQRQSGKQFAPQVVSAVPAAVLAEAPWANQVAAPALS
jgi:response regulator RpfG family c-di-GMP phosphodiesterase